MTKRGLFALVAASLLGMRTEAAAEPMRVQVQRPSHPDALAAETATRLEAELRAAGFTVVAVDPGEGDEVTATPAVATVSIVERGPSAAPEVWITCRVSPTTLVRRVEVAATPGASTPAALAIRAVELLHGSLLGTNAGASDRDAVAPAPKDEGRRDTDSDTPRPPAARRRALLEGPSIEVGLAALYGLGDTTGRLAPTLRFSYGSAIGLAGRLTVMGPTGSDQIGVVELAYALDRWSRVVAPIVSVGAGGGHTHLDDTATPKHPRLRTEAWAGTLSANAGIAARATRMISVLVDGHAFLVLPAPGAVIGAEPAGGRPHAAGTISLGVSAQF
jgi:hypothetical protein